MKIQSIDGYSQTPLNLQTCLNAAMRIVTRPEPGAHRKPARRTEPTQPSWSGDTPCMSPSLVKYPSIRRAYEGIRHSAPNITLPEFYDKVRSGWLGWKILTREEYATVVVEDDPD